MLIKLTGGRVYDPAHQIDGKVMDIFVRDGRIVDRPNDHESIDQEYDLRGKVVMAGAIDMHTHIGGGKVNIARLMLPEDHRSSATTHTDACRAGCGHAAPSTLNTGYRYAEMGYTAGFEPALSPVNARQSHLEMCDIPILDKGGYAMIGSDDYFLRMLAAKKDQNAINDYVAWILHASQAIGIKVVNPGGINAFKFNQRALNLDEQNVHYQVTPREVLQSLTRAVYELGIAHPLHVHGNNLGVPGNVETTLKTMGAVEGYPVHLTHIQFHSYGTEGDRKFSSGAAAVAEALNKHKNVSADVGQILFGQTVTASGDTMRQFANSGHASPNKAVLMDIECDSGCGVVPFKYKDQNFVNALQWAIGLEIFLLTEDPWRIFLTTDHPNGAPFTSYPHLIRLLMDKSFRSDMFTKLNLDAQAMSTLNSIEREYSLYEIAIMTRAGAAKLVGLHDRGHLGVGGAADITVYTDNPDREAMFSKPDYVFKDGELVVRNGEVVKVTWGSTHTVKPDFDRSIEKDLKQYFDRYHTMNMENYKVNANELEDDGRGKVIVQECKGRREKTA
ncbi:formylmethanofuran dehydrogenase, subunit A /formyltransferase/hydrolase complex subunit A [Methylobacillus rhizosphaerae]|uniref:Formylmethanofuran dehydrogenase, subunit A /formyltransferase/hydrolase complex subunit A n=1 Tax=Methylobacillus rhizosphaerae TaxID=551994 RepID=A0A238YJS3_9PROT|nr:formylmethanofuran dehydrogenase subunit A [Methylobacillus rhizosphaerae]SNR71058.1 formylmethanofuran dehydrogenase, subunit A /formyltransferase/hydrolase complex subunit A [Methylobacillus rhizosphaerae]